MRVGHVKEDLEKKCPQRPDITGLTMEIALRSAADRSGWYFLMLQTFQRGFIECAQDSM